MITMINDAKHHIYTGHNVSGIGVSDSDNALGMVNVFDPTMCHPINGGTSLSMAETSQPSDSVSAAGAVSTDNLPHPATLASSSSSPLSRSNTSASITSSQSHPSTMPIGVMPIMGKGAGVNAVASAAAGKKTSKSSGSRRSKTTASSSSSSGEVKGARGQGTEAGTGAGAGFNSGPESLSTLQLAQLLAAQLQQNLAAGATLTGGLHPHSLLNLNTHPYGLSLPQHALMPPPQLPRGVVMPRGLPLPMSVPGGASVPSTDPGGGVGLPTPSQSVVGGVGSLDALSTTANMSAQGIQQALAHQLAISQQLQQLQQMQLLALAANITQQQQQQQQLQQQLQQQQQLSAGPSSKASQPQDAPSLLPYQHQQHPPPPPPLVSSMSLPLSPIPPCKQPSPPHFCSPLR